MAGHQCTGGVPVAAAAPVTRLLKSGKCRRLRPRGHSRVVIFSNLIQVCVITHTVAPSNVELLYQYSLCNLKWRYGQIWWSDHLWYTNFYRDHSTGTLPNGEKRRETQVTLVFLLHIRSQESIIEYSATYLPLRRSCAFLENKYRKSNLSFSIVILKAFNKSQSGKFRRTLTRNWATKCR